MTGASDSQLTEALDRAEALLREATYAVAYTGAGMSAESGIPTFRGEGGLWERYPPERFATLAGLALTVVTSPGRVRAFIEDASEAMLRAEPNPGHTALARLGDAGIVPSVITQNIDDLHDRAGSRRIWKLHGSLFRVRCLHCGKPYTWPRAQVERAVKAVARSAGGRTAMLRGWRDVQPRCTDDGGRMRPDVVLFGQDLPKEDFAKARDEAERCDLLLAIGTSHLVYPAATIPEGVRTRGVPLVEINPEETPLSARATVSIRAAVSEALPELARRLVPDDAPPSAMPSPKAAENQGRGRG